MAAGRRADQEADVGIFHADEDFDAQLQRTLGAAHHGCADVGEAIAVAGQVAAGDYDGWWTAWSAAAQRCEDQGTAQAAAGRTASARTSLLKACEYWRQAFFFLRHDIDDDRVQQGWQAHRRTFVAATPLLGVHVTPFDLSPADGVAVRGYLIAPDETGTERPTVVAPAGYDSMAESGWAVTGAAVLDRGWNACLYEGPGQGAVLYQQRLALRPDWEVVQQPLLDWLVGQKGVDAGRIAVVGRSFAGYLAARGAAGDARVRALVLDPGQYDFLSRMVPGKFDQATWDRVEAGDADIEHDLQGLLGDPHGREWFGARMATLGATTVAEFMRRQVTCTLEGVVDQITCPVLLTEGEGDFAAQTDLLAQHLPTAPDIRRFTIAEGAGGHCEGMGATLWELEAMDWLAGHLDPT